MRLLCQPAHRDAFPHRLTGAENDEDAWGAPDISDYDGQLEAPLSYAFTRSASVPGEAVQSTQCGAMPDAFRLRCRSTTVSVLRAGAALIAGTGAKDVDVPIAARWAPPGLERVEAMSCDVRPIDAPPSPKKPPPERGEEQRASLEWGGFFVLSPVFIAATPAKPGLEWVLENSDSVGCNKGRFWLLPRARSTARALNGGDEAALDGTGRPPTSRATRVKVRPAHAGPQLGQNRHPRQQPA